MNITIGGWILFAVISLITLGTAIYICVECEGKSAIIISIIGTIIILGATLGIESWYFNGTEAGKRAVKDQESNFHGGITRTVDVYDMEGDLLRKYEGEFDVEMHNNYIVFDDENNQRHVIYFTTGTVTIDEVG